MGCFFSNIEDKMLTHSRPNRKISGGKYRSYRKDKLYERAGFPTFTKLGETIKKITKARGYNKKIRLLNVDFVNVIDKKTNKASKVKIITVVENPANRHFVRRNIITKGSVVETEKGRARITSRPGQDGCVNAVLI
jgi:small subunit ribosomal protein S8e